MADYFQDVKRTLRANGCTFVRPGKGDHEIWFSPLTNKHSPVESKIESLLNLLFCFGPSSGSIDRERGDQSPANGFFLNLLRHGSGIDDRSVHHDEPCHRVVRLTTRQRPDRIH